MLFDKRLQSLLIVRQAAMETQTLLRLSQPLQQDMNRGVKLLRLQPEERDQSVSQILFTFYLTTVWAGQYLTQSLLQPGLFGHREVAHRLPASAQLLHLGFDPRRVIVAALNQLLGRAFEGLNAYCPLPQLLLENLQ